MITIYDIAKQAQVSHTTVSRALRNDPNVRETTKKRILRIAEELGYRPNAMASMLSTGETKRIAFLIPQDNILGHAEQISTLEQLCSADGYETVLMQITPDVEQVRRIWEHVLAHSFDAVICYLYEYTPVRNLMQAFLAQQKSILVLGPPRDFEPQPGLFSITVDNLAAVRDAVAMLVAQGHRKIVFTMREKNVPNDREVEQYRAILKECGVTDWNPIFSFRSNGFMDTMQLGYQAGCDLFREKAGVTAVICANDLFALGLMQRLKETGCRIPQDISIVGSDNQRFSEFCPISLTTIEMQMKELIFIAWRTIFNQLQNPDFESVPTTKVLRASLLVRESTGCAPGCPWLPVTAAAKR